MAISTSLLLRWLVSQTESTYHISHMSWIDFLWSLRLRWDKTTVGLIMDWLSDVYWMTVLICIQNLWCYVVWVYWDDLSCGFFLASAVKILNIKK